MNASIKEDFRKWYDSVDEPDVWYWAAVFEWFEKNLLKNYIDDLFNEIKHGDQEHQEWLRNRMNEFHEQWVKK